MNMYTHLLSSVFDDWVDELTGTALVDYALMCRTEMLAPRTAGSACIALAAEIAYDRALIKLCASQQIPVNVMGFSQPRSERERLEHALAATGTDLVVLTRHKVNS
ncbi:MAG TPA: hypothetical protein VMQ40_06250 [Acidimicrobiales bacterium]|jgi:hypothetical protein|nr:hypothetical protein [Acidimicrobiales bacterium]